jgi:CRP-like cAMP-binding protein
MTARDGAGPSALVAKLSHFTALSKEDVRILEALCASEEQFPAHADIAVEGEAPCAAFVLTQGMGCRYRLLADGRRQILGFLLPGDFFDPHVFLLRTMDHSVATLTPARLARIARAQAIEILVRRPRLAAAHWWSTLQDAAIQRERIVALGRRDARGRVAYLLCELVWRKRAIGASDDGAIQLPLTQVDLADALGLTPVHVNRVLQEFRKSGLITLAHRRLRLHDMAMLQLIAGCSETYLHLDGAPEDIARYIDLLEQQRGRSGPRP